MYIKNYLPYKLMAEYTGDIPQNVNFAIKASLKAEKFTVLVECWR